MDRQIIYRGKDGEERVFSYFGDVNRVDVLDTIQELKRKGNDILYVEKSVKCRKCHGEGRIWSIDKTFEMNKGGSDESI